MSNAKSGEQKAYEGHPNKAEIKPKPDIEGRPRKPRGMDNEANKLWDSVVSQLIEQGIATAVDTPALHALCYYWSLFLRTQASIDKHKDFGTTEANRAVSANSKAWDNFRRLAQQFGLTAQARNNVSATVTDDVLEDFGI